MNRNRTTENNIHFEIGLKVLTFFILGTLISIVDCIVLKLFENEARMSKGVMGKRSTQQMQNSATFTMHLNIL